MTASLIAPVDLGALIRRVLAEALARYEDKGVRLMSDCPEASLVLADGERLKQLLSELVADAVGQATRGTAVRIAAAAREDGRVRLSVTIDAPAGPVSDAWLARSAPPAEAMGASAGADDAGSVYWIDLRAARGDSIPGDTETASSRTPGAQFRILYVEDDPSNRKLMATILRKECDMELLTAADGLHGLEEARRLRPALILADINIPGMDGYALLKKLRQLPETAAIPVVAISAEALREDVERALAAGFRSYVFKPFKPRELVAALREALAGAAD